MHILRQELLSIALLNEQYRYEFDEIQEKKPKNYYNHEDYIKLFNVAPDETASKIYQIDTETDIKTALYPSPFSSLNEPREDMRGVLIELSYSLSTDKKYKKAHNICGIYLKDESLYGKRNQIVKGIADELVKSSLVPKNERIQRELALQLYTIMGIDDDTLFDGSDATEDEIVQSNILLRKINHDLYLSGTIYPSPYDIYQKKGIMSFSEEKTTRDIFQSIISTHFKEKITTKEIEKKKRIAFNSVAEQVEQKSEETTTIKRIGAKKKFRQNFDALKVLQTGSTNFTEDEKRVLEKFTGFGGIPQAFYKTDGTASKNWEEEAKELKELLDTTRYTQLRKSTLNAFYTPPHAVKEIYRHLAAYAKDKESLKILEPSVGIGAFLKYMPSSLKSKAKIDCVELDKMTFDIFNAIHTEENIESYNMSYLDFEQSPNSYDIIIGNPPFSNTQLNYNGGSKYLHEHFVDKSLSLLKEDGVMAFVISNAFMDSTSDFKKELSKNTELLGAIRLPSSAFKEEAHTEVVTDIVFLKKTESPQKNKSWINISSLNETPINQYYVNNQKYLLGEWGKFGTMYQGGRPSLKNDNFTWENAFKEVKLFLQEEIKEQNNTANTNRKIDLFDSGGKETKQPTEKRDIVSVAIDTKIDSLFIHDDILYKRLPNFNTRLQYEPLHIPKSSKDNTLSQGKIDKLKKYIELKNVLLDLSKLQLKEDVEDHEIELVREVLNKKYDEATKGKNFLNKTSIKTLLKYDSQYPLLLALEKEYNKGVSKAVAEKTGQVVEDEYAIKADIFYKRTQYPRTEIKDLSNPLDALRASIGEKGIVDLDYMASLLPGYTKNEIEEELLESKAMFKTAENTYETKDEFLSGDVKTKFKNCTNEAHRRELAKVIPKDINPYDIEISFGASWIPEKYIKDFITAITNSKNIDAYYTKHNSQWNVYADVSYGIESKYGTKRARFNKVLNNAINNKKIAIFDLDENEQKILNKQETFLANSKIKLIKEEFSEWILDKKDRRDDIAKIYNDIFNRRAERLYDGSVLPFHGKVSDDVIKLRPHQKNAAFRMSLRHKILLDHTVGTGKTFTLIAGLSELKRLGKINKPLVVVPNHKVTDWAKDWLTLYPNANVLAPDKKDFEKENRQKLFARMVTSEYDAIIIGHSQLIKLKNDPDFESRKIQEEIDEIQEAIDLMREHEDKDTRSIKNAEKKRESLELKYDNLLQGSADDFIHFGELGIDYLAIDESHEFKNLAYTTSLTGVGGMGNPAGSQKAFDLFLKIRYIEEELEKPNIAFLTGTPVSNTLAELYLLKKFLAYDELKEQDLNSFDSWVQQYAKVETTWQLSATGQYKAKDILSTFQNLPELMQLYRSFADIITNEQIQEILKQYGEELPLPKMIGGKPKNIIIEKSFAQEEFIGVEDEVTKTYPEGSLIYRSENLPKKPTKGADNMLVIISDAKKCALDMRIIDPGYSDEEDETKSKKMVEEAMGQYTKYNEVKGTQLIFCDLSTPKLTNSKTDSKIKKVNAMIRNYEEELKSVNIQDESSTKALIDSAKETLEFLEKQKEEEEASKFSVYYDIKNKLINCGVPSEEIVFIHSFKTDEQKIKLYNEVNSGKIRFLLGSTSKMGAGTNVQERLVGLHNLDAPWKPSDLEQREGRIIRQGNAIYNLYKAIENKDTLQIKTNMQKLGLDDEKLATLQAKAPNFEVMVNRYATKGTLDSRMWEILEQKSKFIEKLKAPTNSTERIVKDVQLESMSAGEMKALASDNPLILEELMVKREIDELEDLKKAHNKSLIHVEEKISRCMYYINNEDNLLKELETDKTAAEKIIIEGNKLQYANPNIVPDSNSSFIGKVLINDFIKMEKQSIKEIKVGSIGQFNIEATKQLSDFSSHVTLDLIGEFSEPYSISIDVYSQSPQGLPQKIENMINIPAKKLAAVQNEITLAKENITFLKEEMKPFSKDDELKELRKRHEKIIRALSQKSSSSQKPKESYSKASAYEQAIEKAPYLAEYIQDEVKSKDSNNEHENIEGFISSTVSMELNKNSTISEVTKDKILAYAEMMGDTELMTHAESTDMDTLASIAEYFKHIDEGDYVNYSAFADEELLNASILQK